MKKIGIVLISLIVISLSFLSGCADVEIPEDLLQFQISSFSVEPSIINLGESANLSWVVIGGSSASIDNGIGNVSLSGSRIIIPTITTTYTLTAFNATTSLQATTEIFVRNETEDGNGQEASFPNIATRDHIDECTDGPNDNLFTIEHRAGETLDWSSYRVYILTSDDTDVTDHLYFDDSLGEPVGSFSVGDKVVVREALDVVDLGGDTLEITIIDVVHSVIVYQNTVDVE
jgi:hypothetical protein